MTNSKKVSSKKRESKKAGSAKPVVKKSKSRSAKSRVKKTTQSPNISKTYGRKINAPLHSHVNEVTFPIVGVGASAGGLEAFSNLLNYLPTDTGMAFVFIQHLAPKHESMLTDLLSRQTMMPVAEVTDGMQIIPDH